MCSETPVDGGNGGVDVARDGEVDQDAPARAGRRPAAMSGSREEVEATTTSRRRDRGAQVGEVDRSAAEPRGQRCGPDGVAVGDRDRPDAARGEVGGDELGHPARAHDQHRARSASASPSASAASSAATEAGEAPPSPIAVSWRTRFPASSAWWKSRFVTGPVVSHS